MDIELELKLEDRQTDRVVVSFFLSPTDGPASIDGAALQLVDVGGEELCPQVLLPVTGRVTGPMALSVEVRGSGPLPDGARVVAIAWCGPAQAQVSIPAQPARRLRDHLRGAVLGLPADDDVLLEPLTGEGRLRLERRFPWIAEPLRHVEGLAVLEAVDDTPTAEELKADLGIDDDCAAWLHELLGEE
ncbi:MAG: hypothetical protein H6733_04330 [Alphaproteobacteria bacterium]|nr:hypothetical protein [Alphaproteobacteria bacterium]